MRKRARVAAVLLRSNNMFAYSLVDQHVLILMCASLQKLRIKRVNKQRQTHWRITTKTKLSLATHLLGTLRDA